MQIIKLFAGFAMLGGGAALMLIAGTRPANVIKIEEIPIYEGEGGGRASSGAGGVPSNLGTDPTIGADTPPSEYGELLAQGAYNSIGISTADIPGTEGGNLGCGAAVSIIFMNTTGQQLVPGQDITLGTEQIYSSLSNDPRFVAVAVNNAQPGDIIVTARGSSAGHAGIVGNGGDIISNSSGGFAGSKPGTIQNNYTIDKWQSSVTTRNPDQTMAFRYIGG